MLTDQQVISKYGQPGDMANLITIILPYPMRIAWDTKTKVNKMTCHKLIADRFANVFRELLAHYGYEQLVKLDIDLFGGCYNFRKMRGGNRWSRHSWPIAIDLSPTKNGLKTPYAKAQFSKPEYAKMHEIFEKHNFFNLGKTKNYDAMHFESLI